MSDNLSMLLSATWQSIYMVIISGCIAVLGGLPLGIILMCSRPDGILKNTYLNNILGLIVNIFRAVPFIILLVALIPLTRLIIGTSIGTTAAIVPLSIAAIPFVARIIESALLEVGSNMIETGFALGASPWQIIIKILLPEAMPTIINGITITLINLVGYSAMAGAVGGGGLGSVAINYGYQRFDTTIMILTTSILVCIVYAIQLVGDLFAKRFAHQ